ncbi:unnamed protein product, partial [Closterium sp. NIES-53]
HPCVAFLDTDVGQPEFTPPGLVSLHLLSHPVFGHPALHQRTPIASHLYGDISPGSDPALYLRQIFSLYDCFRQNYYDGHGAAAIPLVINTHGWIKGELPTVLGSCAT